MRIGILHEHPEWFLPLFGALNRRGIEHVRIDATALRWDPTERPAYDLLVNRMSPSAYLRGHGHAIFATGAYLQYVESWDVPVVNGSAQWRLEISKSAQLDLFDALGMPFPRSRVINHASQALAAADRLRYPIVVKPNIGGSGARIQRFERWEDLGAAVAGGTLDLGIDATALVQEFLPAADGSITRLELLDGHLLYAIRITPPADHGFNLCPADICQTGRRRTRGGPAERAAAARPRWRACAPPSRRCRSRRPRLLPRWWRWLGASPGALAWTSAASSTSSTRATAGPVSTT